MTAKYRIDVADCTDWLAGLDDGSADLIIADPAYESLEKHRKVGTTTRLTGEWFDIFGNERFPAFLEQCYRVLKKNSHLYLFCDAETMFVAKPAGEEAGFKFWKPIIWDKVKIGMGYHYRARCERILFFEKGKRKLNDLGVPDVLQFERIRGGYPTEKPADLLRLLVTQSTEPGDLVINPFCGSGSSGEAALLEGRDFRACDLKPSAVSRARERLSAFGTDLTVSTVIPRTDFTSTLFTK